MPHTLLIEASSRQYAQCPIRPWQPDANKIHKRKTKRENMKKNLSNERFVVWHMVLGRIDGAVWRVCG